MKKTAPAGRKQRAGPGPAPSSAAARRRRLCRRPRGRMESVMSIKVGINGFGRIGRLVLRASIDHPDIEIKGINSTMAPDYMIYLLKYDTVHGTFGAELGYTDNSITINGREIPVCMDRDPHNVHWDAFGVEYLAECTGKFLTKEKAMPHVENGAKKVIFTAPSKDDTPMFVMGVNEDTYTKDMTFVSNASCTTNCLAPLAKVIQNKFGIELGLMTTVHSATATQKTVDSASGKDRRSGRSIVGNIIPASTGAAKAVGKVIPALNGRLTGMAMRIPAADVSVVDLTCQLSTSTSYEEICAEVRRASQEEMAGVIEYVDEDLVSADFIGNTHTSIFDARAGMMLGDRFVKLIAWYDNECGYAAKCLDLMRYMYDAENR